MKKWCLKRIWRSLLRQTLESVLWIGPAFGASPAPILYMRGFTEAPKPLPDSAPAGDVKSGSRYTGSPNAEGPAPLRREMPSQAMHIKPARPLTRAERAAWASLVKRLR